MDTSYEPMEVDLSINSVSCMDISSESNRIKEEVEETDKITQSRPDTSQFSYVYNTHSELMDNTLLITPHDTKIYSNVKKYHINYQYEKKSRKNWQLIAIIIIGIAIATSYVSSYKCADVLDNKNLKEILMENVYGQSDVIENLVDALNLNASSKILFLYGGTGVGKTFAVSLVMQGSWNAFNIYHYTMPGFANSFSSEFMLGLTLCQRSILIVDDLSKNDIHNIKSHIVDVITKSTRLGKNITVMLIINTDNIYDDFGKQHPLSFHKELEEQFQNLDTVKKYIPFNRLKQEHLYKCIAREMQTTHVDPTVMNYILKNFDVAQDGCKGVYKKIKFLSVT